MATRHLFPVSLRGASHAGEGPQFDYLASGGAPVVHLLGAKLVEIEPVDERTRHEFWAASKRHRRVVTIGDGAEDFLATARFDNQPYELKAMLFRGLQGATLNYRLTSAGTVYPLQLVQVVGASSKDSTPIRPDRDLWRVGNYEARLHLRRIDGGSVAALLNGANAQ